MLISRKYKFIFIHIYKNAGTSIKEALIPFERPAWQSKVISAFNRIGSSLGVRRDKSHMTASELISEIGKDVYDQYYSFAFVRNPWDWQVSLYTYMLKNKKHFQHELAKAFRDFDEYIKWRCTHEVRYQKDFIFSSTGEQLVDTIGKYERLEDDFRYICSQIGVSATLPRMNVSKTKDYRMYYTEETKELVRRTFAPDIQLFGYDFE